MEKAVISQPQSLQLPKISVARRNQFPWILFHEQEGPKPFPPRGCCLTPWNKHRNSVCWVKEIIYTWGYCSSVCSPSMLVRFKAELLNPHWTFSVRLLFGLRAEGSGLQTVQEAFYQSAGKTASSLPHPFPWHFLVLLTCSHSSSLLFWIHMLCTHSFHTDERNHKLLEWNTDSSEIRFCSEGWEMSAEPENFIIHKELIWNLPLPWHTANSPVHAEEGLTWILAVPISVLPVGRWKWNSNWELKITYSTCTACLADKSTGDSRNVWHPSVFWKREQLLNIIL